MSRRPTALILTAALTGALPLGAGLAAAPAAGAAAPSEPFVAEIHYDDAGPDTGELVEVQLPPGTTSEGWSVVRYNGSGGAPYGTDALPVVTADDADAVALLEYPANGLQNGSPDGLALVRPDGSVAELLSYEGTFTAVGGPADGQGSTDVGVAENGEPEGRSLSRVSVDGSLEWRGPGPATPGAVNPTPAAPPPSGASCEADAVAIGQVQGDGASTPLDGEAVSVRGTVVGDTPGLGGFYLQDGGDGDAATSDAVFVPSAADVALGDTVAVAGTAGEGFGQTQVVPAGESAVAVCATGGALPEPAALALPSSDAQREATEGMLVAPTAPLSVSEVFNLTRFGELTLSAGGVLLQPTEVSRPGEGAEAVAADNAARRITLDDGSTARLDVTDAPYLSPTTPVRVGDTAALDEPVVLGYGFGAWRLEPADGTADGLLAPGDTRPAAPAKVGGDVQIASFNVLNYFLTFTDPPGRGASDQAGLDAQAAKIVAAIDGLGADVVTLEEIEDTDSTGYTPGDADTAVADLVTRLNDAQGSAVWAYAPFPTELYGAPRDVIRNAIVYRTDAVAPVGPAVADVDESVWSNAREPIAQTFAPVGPDGAALPGGDAFTVVGNHLKSKGGTGTGDNDAANTDGQGAFNGDRVRQARSVADFVGALQKSTGDDDVLVLGDLNAYTQEDPVQVLRDAGLTDLGSGDPGKHSYVFDALSGSLDHALGTASLSAKVTGVDTWLINAQESFAYQYDGDPALYAPNPYRASDHDPLVLGLALDAPAPPAPAVPTCRGQEATIVGTNGRDVLRGTNGPDVIVGLGGDDVIDARGGDDVVCGGPGNDVVQGGYGDDRVYGQSGNDVINGGPGDDRISGGAGRDVMAGGGGHDYIDGVVRQYFIG